MNTSKTSKPSQNNAKSAGRPCSICADDRVTQINSAISRAVSFRSISRSFFSGESKRHSIRRHSENCLNLEIQALLQEKKIDEAINHYKEIIEQLEFAKGLQKAARYYLISPVTGEIALCPRTNEIKIIYEDYSDLNSKGKPKKKTATLDFILAYLKDNKIKPQKIIFTHTNMPQFALKTIDRVNKVLDKVARIEGLYNKGREKTDDLTEVKKHLQRNAEKLGTNYQIEVKAFLEDHGHEIKPEIKRALENELE